MISQIRQITYKLVTTNALLLYNIFLLYNTLLQHVSIPIGIILRNKFKSQNYTIRMTIFCYKMCIKTISWYAVHL
jgi:hypothetical protein